MAAIDAKRARALVGVPFRTQGRDPKHGLDCVGLCLAAYQMPFVSVRADYRLRGNHLAEIKDMLSFEFRKVANSRARPGDLMIMQLAADQFHLGILTKHGIVHADARLRRVVETPGQMQWPTVATYRRRRRFKS